MFHGMQNRPADFSIDRTREHVAGDSEIVSRLVESGSEYNVHRYTYKDAHRRSRQLANALTRLNVQRGERIATLAWNGYRHFELYFGVSGMGAGDAYGQPNDCSRSKSTTSSITPKTNCCFSI